MTRGECRVLVVEDDSDLAGLVTLALESEGYEVVAAPHGAAALKAVDRSGLPRVILLDIMMPVMDGHEFARKFRESHVGADARIIVMTAAADARARAEQVRADGFLGKPFEIDELLDIVARHARL